MLRSTSKLKYIDPSVHVLKQWSHANVSSNLDVVQLKQKLNDEATTIQTRYNAGIEIIREYPDDVTSSLTMASDVCMKAMDRTLSKQLCSHLTRLVQVMYSTDSSS